MLEVMRWEHAGGKGLAGVGQRDNYILYQSYLISTRLKKATNFLRKLSKLTSLILLDAP